MRDELLKNAKRIVIKVGSSLVASRETGLRPERIDRLADEIAAQLLALERAGKSPGNTVKQK